MNLDQIENIKKTVEAMNKFDQLEILKILSKNICKINENKSGVFVNLSLLPQPVLHEINDYIHYIKDQEDRLNKLECKKTEFKNAFFVDKDNKEDSSNKYIPVYK
uniref:NET domain-containing protein n=1 Tax=viral metagenome TaxID=1070528 RepID=A0A6C0DRQ3_9ZZZZ